MPQSEDQLHEIYDRAWSRTMKKSILKQEVEKSIKDQTLMDDYLETTIYDEPATWNDKNSGDDPDE